MKLFFFDNWKSKARWYFDRSFSEKSTSQIAWLIGIILVVFFLIWIFSYPFTERMFEDSNPSMSRELRIISLLINPGAVSEVNPTMRIFAILVAVIGIIILSGFLITVLSNMLERHVEHYKNGDIHYKLKDHVIVIGFNEHTISLIKRLLSEKGKHCKILLVSSAQTSIIRERIEAEFSRNIWKQIIYYSEDTTSLESLSLIDSDKAEEIYVLGDSIGNDNLKIQCIDHLLTINKERSAPLIPCYLFLESSTTLFIIKQKGLTRKWGKIMRVIPVNITENWAKKVLIFGDYYGYSPIKLIGSKGHNRLIIIGMTNWSKALSEVYARISHYPSGELNEILRQMNYPSSKYVGYSTITFIDEKIDDYMDKFCGAYSSLFEVQKHTYIDTTSDEKVIKEIGEGGNFLDINFVFIKGVVHNSYIKQYLNDAAYDETTIAICYDDDNYNIEIAVQLPEKLYENRIPVYVRQKYDNIVTSIINNEKEKENKFGIIDNKYSNIYAFGMIENQDIIFDDDDSYVQFIVELYENKSENYVRSINRFNERVNKYIENLYHGYYIYLLWSQIDSHYDREEIKQMLARNKNIFIEIEHLRWCVNKLMSGISSTYHENKVYFGNEYITSFDSLNDEFKQYSAVNIDYIQELINNGGVIK